MDIGKLSCCKALLALDLMWSPHPQASPKRQAAQSDLTAYKLSQWQHWSLMADVHGAIVHAHRPYMVRDRLPSSPTHEHCAEYQFRSSMIDPWIRRSSIQFQHQDLPRVCQNPLRKLAASTRLYHRSKVLVDFNAIPQCCIGHLYRPLHRYGRKLSRGSSSR